MARWTDRAGILVLTVCILSCGPSREALQDLPVIDLMSAEPQVAELLNTRLGELQESPESARRWGRLGIAYDAHSFFQAAAYCYRQAASLEPDRYRWSYLAALATRRSQPAQASPLFEAAARLQPQNPAFYLNFGDHLFELGQLLEARAQYEKALNLDSDSSHGRYGLARLDLQAGDLTAARTRLQEALASTPGFGQAHLLLAQVLRRLGDEPGAAREQALALAYPDPSAPPDPVYAEVAATAVSSRSLTSEGLRALKAADFEKAEGFFRKVLTIRAGNSRDFANLGAALIGQGNSAASVEPLMKALELNPRETFAHQNLALALFDRNELQKALNHARQAIQIDPAFAEAYNTQGLVLGRLRRYSEAIQSFEGAIERNPGLISARNNLAKALADSGQLDAAVTHWEEVLQIQPNQLEALYNLAQARSLQRLYSDSILLFEKGLQIAPRSSLLSSGLAWLLAAAPDQDLRDGERALQLISSVRQQYPDDPHITDVFAAALAEVGRFDEAAQAATRAHQLALGQKRVDLIQQLQRRQRGYQRGQPFRLPR